MTTSTRVAQLKSSIQNSKESLEQLRRLKESGSTQIESSDGTYVVDIDDAIYDYEYDLGEEEYELSRLLEEEE